MGLTVTSGDSETVVTDYSRLGECASLAADWDLERLEAGQYMLHGHRGRQTLVRFLTADELIAWAEAPHTD